MDLAAQMFAALSQQIDLRLFTLCYQVPGRIPDYVFLLVPADVVAVQLLKGQDARRGN